jgi:hypothetical protein
MVPGAWLDRPMVKVDFVRRLYCLLSQQLD